MLCCTSRICTMCARALDGPCPRHDVWSMIRRGRFAVRQRSAFLHLSHAMQRVPSTARADVRIRQEQSRSAGRRQVGASGGSRRSRPTIRWRSTARSLAELGRIAEPDGAPHAAAARGRVLSSTRNARGLRKSLTVQYIEHATRSSKIEHQLWSALFDLTQAFLFAYYAFAREVSHHAQSRQVAAAAARARCAGRSCTWASTPRSGSTATSSGSPPNGRSCTRCSRSPARASSSARSCRAAAAAAAPRRSSTSTSIALLLQLMNAGNMTARHLEWVADELDEWCAPLRLSLEPSSVTSFYVDLGAREGLRRRTPAPLEGRVLFLDTRPLHSMLMQNVMMLEQKIKAQPLSDRTPKRTEQLGLLDQARLAGRSRIQAVRAPRRAHGGRGHRRCDRRLREDLGLPARGGPRDADPSIRARQELRRHDRARGVRPHAQRGATAASSSRRRRFAQFAAPGGPWEVKDVSQTGFRLLAPMSVANAVTLGHAGRHPPAWAGAVDARHRAPDEADDRGPRRDRPAGDRQHARGRRPGRAAQGRRRRLLGGRRGRHDQRPHVSRACSSRCASARPTRRCSRSIVPAAEYQPAKRLRLIDVEDDRSPIRFGRLLEQQPDWVWATVESADLTAADAVGGLDPGPPPSPVIPPAAANE